MATPIHSLGRWALGVVEEFGAIAVFASHMFGRSFTRPFRWRRILDEIFVTGVLSLAIVCASGAAVGFVLGLQGYVTLTQFGAEESLGAVVALSLIRELGPVLTALLVTGRAGSAVAAEIGAMVATEQLDGLRMMSVDPVDYVAQPKALALIIGMPLLSALFILFGLGGGYVVGVGQLGLDGGAYLSSVENSINFADDVAGGLIKALVFGVLIALISTYRGYTSAPNSAGVSRATTRAVVQASVATLIFDFFITALWGI